MSPFSRIKSHLSSFILFTITLNTRLGVSSYTVYVVITLFPICLCQTPGDLSQMEKVIDVIHIIQKVS